MRNCRLVHLLLLLPLRNISNAQNEIVRVENEIVRFSFQFGFFEDELTPVTEVIKEDVEAVICQTQYFLSQLVQEATGTKSVHAKATEIDWGYYEGLDFPAHINFTVIFTDAAIEGDVNWVDELILVDRMEALGDSGLQSFITNYVWKAEPVDLNFFMNANRMTFDGVRQAPVEGSLQEAECPETFAPTISPTASPAPTNELGNISPPPSMATGIDIDDSEDLDENDPIGGGANGTAADLDSPGAIGNGTDPGWPFGSNYNQLLDLDAMTNHAVSFFLFTGKERPPTEMEVNSLLCEINDFFTAELRKNLNDNTIHAKAVYVDYYFLDEGAGSGEDITVNFTAFAYYGDEKHTQVHADDVFEAMKLTNSELKNFVEDYVWKSEPEQENIFFHTESVSMDAGKGRPVNEQAMLIEARGCLLSPANGDGGAIPPTTGAGSEPNNTGAAIMPGTDDPGQEGDAKWTQITTVFRVSNVENIKTAQAVRAEGLDQSFPSFAHMIVEEMTKRDITRRLHQQHRSLRVVLVPNSATIDSVLEFDCPGNALPDLTCHEVLATYDVLMSSDEDENQINSDYTDATNRAANDGSYNNDLQRVVPDTPLYIGVMTSKDQIPPGSQNEEEAGGGLFNWSSVFSFFSGITSWLSGLLQQ